MEDRRQPVDRRSVRSAGCRPSVALIDWTFAPLAYWCNSLFVIALPQWKADACKTLTRFVRVQKKGGDEMTINYNPDGKPSPSPEFFEFAAKCGQNVFGVICDEPDAVVGDDEGVSFAAISGFLPRQGDRIQLEDSGLCEVKRVYFKIVRMNGHITLFPTVRAVRLERPE